MAKITSREGTVELQKTGKPVNTRRILTPILAGLTAVAIYLLLTL